MPNSRFLQACDMNVAPSTASSLLGALSKISSNAVPGLVDAILLTTHCSPSSLLLALLQRFPDVYKKNVSTTTSESVKGELEVIRSYLAAVQHLQLHEESEEDDLLMTFWTAYVPLLRCRDPELSILQIQVAEMLAEATSSRSDWDKVKGSVVPLCLSSLYPPPKMRGGSSTAKDGTWSDTAYSEWQRLERDYKKVPEVYLTKFHDELLSIYAVSQLVDALLSAALKASSSVVCDQSDDNDKGGSTTELQKFCESIVAAFLGPALTALAQPLDESLRRYSTQNLLPPLLKSASRFGWSHDISPEKRIVNARTSLMQEVWLSCQTLSSHGSSQRRDAYMALALLAELLFPSELPTHQNLALKDASDVEQYKKFDIQDDAEFWEMLKLGLGDSDALTRKRALYVFKRALSALHTSTATPNNLEKNGNVPPQRDSSQKGHSKGSKIQFSSKRNKWADEEAASLGVGAVKNKITPVEGWSERWNAFILLHETLEEYGTHLVEAAWGHQMPLLLQFTKSKGDSKDSGPYWADSWSHRKSRSVEVNFAWISVLWKRGFDHTNPQVRRLVMQSFLEFEWERIRKLSSLVPEHYVLGSLLQALDDAVLHKDFGMKGNYSSTTAEGAAKFMGAYSASLPLRRRIGFVVRLAKAVLNQSRSRAGLMTLVVCLEAAALGLSIGKLKPSNMAGEQILSSDADILKSEESPLGLLELLKSVVENSKHHFNPKYRAKVCGHVLRTASALVILPGVPFSKFSFFLSSFPRELLVMGGSLHSLLMSWVYSSEPASGSASHLNSNKWVLEGVHGMAELLLISQGPFSHSITDEDVEAWRMEAGKWARLVVIGFVKGEDMFRTISLIEQHVFQMYNQSYAAMCAPERVLILIQSLLKECTTEFLPALSTSSGAIKNTVLSESGAKTQHILTTSISSMVLSVLDELKDYARRSAGIFWEVDNSGPTELPASVGGKLGGPSQRRLPCALTSAVLQAVLAISAVSDCCLWCCQVGRKMDIQESVLNFMWQFAWEAMAIPVIKNEVGAELQLAAYEALISVCNALAATAHPFYVTAAHASMNWERKAPSSVPEKPELMVENLIKALLQNVESAELISNLARSRRAVLAACKWSCLDSLLCIPKSSMSGNDPENQYVSASSSSTLDVLFQDSIDSLESAGEEYLLSLLRCIRWLIHWGVLATLETDEDPEKKYQVAWTLVQSGWSAMADCNKRKVAPTAAFLSAMFHPAIFCDIEMHGSQDDEEEHGPLKWLLNRLIEQGVRSPRTMRLTALHVTGLFLKFPGTTIFYIQELKKLALHGGESVDEELDGEILESQTSAREYATLIQSSDPELTEEFTNSEMYVRVMVGVMVHKLALLYEDPKICEDVAGCLIRTQAANFGQKFLRELLFAAVNDEDLSKELYKKKSAIHRRKVRVWQLLCILSRFLVAEDILKVTSLLESSLFKNNMPSVRQYIETFAVQVYLRFPHLVEESLIPVLHDYNMRMQALSSYVLIATNVLMFSPAPHQKNLLQQILPAIFPFLTSHHHSLRSFTQVLVFKIIRQFSTPEGLLDIQKGALAGQCLQKLADFLECNADCARMRMCVEKHVDSFDAFTSTEPRGIFCTRDGEIDPSQSAEDHPFECVPVAVLDVVGDFLSEVREELRESMAADALVLHTEHFNSSQHGLNPPGSHTKGLPNTTKGESESATYESESCRITSVAEGPDILPSGNWDIQKKIVSLRFSDSNTAYDVEEELLLSTIESRAKELIRMRGNRQDLIVVASLLGRVPNLAGLARTCEVFKASSLVVADATIAQDRQFQLISVTADQWIPLVEVPELALSNYLKLKRNEGYSILGLEQTVNSISIDKYTFPKKVVLVLGRESDGIPWNIIQALDSCVEIPQLGVIRSLNVHVSGAIAIWEYTRQHLIAKPAV